MVPVIVARMFLIDDLLMAPIRGVVALGRKVQEIAESEVFDDEGKLKRELQEAQLRFDMDEISEEEYDRRERDILTRLRALRDRTGNTRGVDHP